MLQWLARIMKNIEHIEKIITVIGSSLITLFAGYIGIAYGTKKDYIKTQITDFYAPLLGILKSIKVHTELRYKIHQENKKLLKNPSTIPTNQDVSFDKTIKYNNEKYKNSVSLYKKMVDIFRKNFYLAEKSTIKWFKPLSDYVELSDRAFKNAIPEDLLIFNENFQADDKELLDDFYSDLEKNLNRLTGKLNSIWKIFF
jgi:hypothetical protein